MTMASVGILVLHRPLGSILQVSYTRRLIGQLYQQISKGNASLLSSGNSLSSDSNGKSEVKTNTDLVNDKDDAWRIISRINEASETELSAMKHISSSIAARIASHREQNGRFARAEDLLGVHGIGRQTLMKICEELSKPPSLFIDAGKSDGPSTTGDRLGVTASSSSTTTSSSSIGALRDVVAVDIGLKHLSWVHMSRERWVRQWRVRDIMGISPSKWDPPAYLREIRSTIAEMPKPDVYVLQHKTYATADKSTFQMILFQRTLEGVLYTALNEDNNVGTLPRAISMSQAQIGHHFNLQVKGNRMSGQSTVADILRDGETIIGQGDECEEGFLRARVPRREDMDTFHGATKHEKEHLSNCLLLAIAFYDLMVDRKGKS